MKFGTFLFFAGSLLALGQTPPAPPAPPPAVPGIPAAPARAPRPPKPPKTDHEERNEYRDGQRALDRHEWDEAIQSFNNVIELKGSRADGALYWRAYAENRLGRKDAALATLAELRRSYPSSAWLEDAKALELEVRQGSRNSNASAQASDEDLHLLILNNGVESDPDRIIPVLEKILKGTGSNRVKERAMFVLAQSHNARAREVLLNAAKGGLNPDLQARAIEYLSVFGGKEGGSALTEIYKNAKDPGVKRSIIRSFMINGNRDALLGVARNEQSPELRAEAVRQLSVMGGGADLLQLYNPNGPPEVKQPIVNGLFISGQRDHMFEIARDDKDPGIRRLAIQKLGIMGRGNSGTSVAELYAKESDAGNRREILRDLFLLGDWRGLSRIARAETDPGLKREAIRQLALINSKEAQDILLEGVK